MTKLNLGYGPPSGPDSHPLSGFINLDKHDGWHFEDGLADYLDGSIEGISCSHALMYVDLPHWPFIFSEFARVLEPGGVIRITEDETANPRSSRYGGFHDAVTLTSAKMIAYYLLAAGLEPRILNADQTLFKDDSLMQSWHGKAPKVCFVEGIKE